MLIKNVKLRQKLSLILPALAFFIAAYGSAVESVNYFFGVFYFIVGLANLILLRFIEKNTLLTNIIVNGLNAIVSLIIGIQFYTDGKLFIPYAYFIIVLLYLFITYRFLKKYYQYK